MPSTRGQGKEMEKGPSQYKVLLSLALAGLFLVGIGLTLWKMPRQEGRLEIIQPTPAAFKEIKVYVGGAVARVGVYTLKEGQRVEDALAAAGGASALADLSRLNLAARVRDEMQIYVPLPGENTASSSQIADPRIDINTASAALLETLPDVGPVTAQNIISYRQKNGPFKRVEDLTEAKLVGPSAFAKIKDLVTVR